MPLEISTGSKASDLLRLKDGDTVTVLFLDHYSSDEFVTVITHYYGNRVYECLGDECALCAKGVPTSRRHFAEVFNITEGVNQVLDIPASLGVQLANTFENMEEAGIDPQNTAIKIKRVGNDRNTTWNPIPVNVRIPKATKKFKVQEFYKKFIKPADSVKSDGLENFVFSE